MEDNEVDVIIDKFGDALIVHLKKFIYEEERRRDTIRKAIKGRIYKYREDVDNIISKLEKTSGNEYIYDGMNVSKSDHRSRWVFRTA